MAREPRTLLRWRYSICKDIGSAVKPGKGGGVSSAGTLLACTSAEAIDAVLRDEGLAGEVMERHTWFSGGLTKIRKSHTSTDLTIATVLVVVTDPRRDDPLREGG